MIGVPFTVPVDPDSGPARQLLIDELSKPEYRTAQPTWFDRLAQSFEDWLNSLTIGTNGITQGPVLIVVALLIVGAVVAAYFVFGPPRLNRKSAIGTLFGEDDARDAAAMRRAAQEAAAHRDYTLAIQEMFRSLARGLAERTVVTPSPGTTALGFAAAASAAFPTFAGRLDSAAAAFDRVRYLGQPGSEVIWRELAELESDLRSARPVLPELAGATR